MAPSLKTLLILFLGSSAAQAQLLETAPTTPQPKNKWYVGVAISTISYAVNLETAEPRYMGIGGSIKPWLTPHIGYKLSRRSDLQIALSYAKDKIDHAEEYNESAEQPVLYTNRRITTKGWAIPLAFRFTPFNPDKRIQLYALSKITPVFGNIAYEHTVTETGASTTLDEIQDSKLDLFFNLGVHAKYKFNSRLSGYAEGNFLHKNLDKNNPGAKSNPTSVGIGLDFKL